MPNLLVAGNSTNGGTAITTDTSGTLNIVTGSGSGANAITIDASQNVVFANAISVAGSTTITGALAVTGSITATGGVSGGIRSGTAVASTSGTSIDFTSLPTGLKRITVMFNGVSTNSTSPFLIQIGSGSITSTGYLSAGSTITNGSVTGVQTSTIGFVCSNGNSAAGTVQGAYRVNLLNGNIWVAEGTTYNTNANQLCVVSGGVTLGGTLDRIRVTTVNGTDTFDAGSINILFE